MNPNQLDLYADRHDAQDSSLAAGKTGHRDDTARVETAIAHLIRRGEPFTADNVHYLVENDGGGPYKAGLVASAMGQLARPPHPVIVEADMRAVPSCRRTRKGSRNRWWIGAQTARQEEAA